eukprot:TRINITY_DN4033_c0_g2_i16.p1 TRINITY_DN4033_c0_g2~~TRINITY_DN4033_c0_g2_i16.p1  ORF type:complete len:535 (-),score=184.43 TRINITY_DN4033_c0_g2_i16:528-2132(-)
MKKMPTTEQLHMGPVVAFPLGKNDKKGKKQSRTLAMSNQGVSCLDGKVTQVHLRLPSSSLHSTSATLLTLSSFPPIVVSPGAPPFHFFFLFLFFQKWFVPSEDVHKVEMSEEQEDTLTLTLLHRYVFEADSESQAKTFVETCNRLQLGAQYNRGNMGQFDEDLTLDDFELSSVLGKGSFGKVLLAERRDNGEKYAMKILDKEELFKRDQIEHIKTEHAIMSTITHPYMVQLHYSFQTDSKLYMCLDYVDGGELFYHLKHAGSFPEELARFYIAEICSVLGFLHQHNIVYRDLKPENVLLTKDGHIKITDFGLAKSGITSVGGKAEGETTKTFCGTPEYLAPEVLTGIGHGKAVDWWSAGILLYEMLTGMPPFYSNNRNEMYILTIKGELEFPDHVSEEAKDVLLQFLDRDPEQRLGSTEEGLESLMNHPFFATIDWDKLRERELNPPMIPETLQNYDEGDDVSDDEEEEDEEEEEEDEELEEGDIAAGSGLEMESNDRDSEASYDDEEVEPEEELTEGPKKTIIIDSDSSDDED